MNDNSRLDLIKSYHENGKTLKSKDFSEIIDIIKSIDHDYTSLDINEEEANLLQITFIDGLESKEDLISRDSFAISFMYFPVHLIPFSCKLELFPLELIAEYFKSAFKPDFIHLEQQDLDNQLECIQRAIFYINSILHSNLYINNCKDLSRVLIENNSCNLLLNKGKLSLSNEWDTIRECCKRLLVENLGIDDKFSADKSNRVGILCSHIGHGECTLYTITILKALKDSGFETILICDSQSSNTIQRHAESLASKVIPLPKDIGNAIATIRNQFLDTLVITDAIYDIENPSFLLSLIKLATKQFTLPSSIVLGKNEISVNGFLYDNSNNSSDLNECQAHGIHSLSSSLLIDLPSNSEKLEVHSRKDLGVNEADVLMISGADCNFITPDVLNAWFEIVNKSRKYKLVLLPFHSSNAKEDNIENFRHKFVSIAESIKAPIDQIKVLCDKIPSIYELDNYISKADIYLESFPCNTLLPAGRAIKYGVPVICMKGHAYRETLTEKMVISNKCDGYLSSDKDEYITNALQAAKSMERHEAKSFDTNLITKEISEVLS